MRKIIIHSQDYLRIISQAEIVYCKSNNSYTGIHLENGEELIICKSLAKFSKELGLENFIRINQSYLINKNFIKTIDKKRKHILLINNVPVPFTISIKNLLIQMEDVAT